jgi:hypothetical protein
VCTGYKPVAQEHVSTREKVVQGVMKCSSCKLNVQQRSKLNKVGVSYVNYTRAYREYGADAGRNKGT